MNNLSPRQQSLMLIGKYVATGRQEPLKAVLNQAFEQKALTVNESKDAMVQLYAYSGFPRVLNGLNSLMNVVQARQEKGLNTENGRSATALPKDFDSLAVGKAVQTELIGSPVQGGVFDFAPDINRYLQAHLFGDLFASDLLTWQERELLTLGALGGNTDTLPQYQAHQKVAKHNGVSDEQLGEIDRLLKD